MTKNFVFTSAGDNTSFMDLWFGEDMQYDVHVIYYGDKEERFAKCRDRAKTAERRKGSKFQNFKYFFERYPEIIAQYDQFFILDDDILIDVPRINKIFGYARQYDLKICGPAFFPDVSKISQGETTKKEGVLLTYTNFVEVNIPLFSKEALLKFMPFLDERLIGWGIDYLYIWCNGSHERKSFAIIHDIGCVNPKDDDKEIKGRELRHVAKWQERANIWHMYAAKIGCPSNARVVEYENLML